MVITVVTGPPCSGKSTYVRTHARPGDIVVDFDILAQALGSPTPHDHSAATRHVTIQARRAAIAAALTVADKVPVWIVDCNISPERMAAYKTAGARVVTMGAAPEVLHQRASSGRPPRWHQLVDRWALALGLEDPVPGSRQW